MGELEGAWSASSQLIVSTSVGSSSIRLVCAAAARAQEPRHVQSLAAWLGTRDSRQAPGALIHVSTWRLCFQLGLVQLQTHVTAAAHT
jgi:hypothetical protein